MTVVRLGLWRLHWKSLPSPEHIAGWAAVAVGGSLLSGLLWGIGVFLTFPDQENYQLFLALVIAGMCAGVTTVYASHLPTVLAFMLPATLPLAWRFFWYGRPLQMVAGAMTLVFATAMSVAARRFQRWFDETMSARFRLEHHSRELDDANARLRTEIGNHRATQDMLLQLQKIEAIGRLTAGIAHDFNNLLMAISGTADLIELHLGPEGSRKVGLQAIHQATERGATLTGQLLAFARKQALLPRLIDVNESIRDMRHLLGSTAGRSLTVELRLSSGPMLAFVDPVQIETVILNLAINARDATPDGGCLTIATAHVALARPKLVVDLPAGDYVMISVADTGSGMAEEVQARAFEPFFTTKGPGRGSGLGLSQVYGFVRQSGGATAIESAVGAGTIIRIYLPRAADTTRQPQPPPASRVPALAARPTGSRILLLDDDPAVRRPTAALLREVGYDVTEAATSAAALREIDQAPAFRLIIVDYAMPDVRGDQFARMARTRQPRLPVLFVTGNADPTPLRDERWLLVKPFRAALLVKTIADAIEDGIAIADAPATRR
ncbi:MAG: ATP-binding protein [Pseudomonadota bacterium]|nr:ATP-binding protein [Pseudomonadota bacterium]